METEPRLSLITVTVTAIIGPVIKTPASCLLDLFVITVLTQNKQNMEGN